MYCNQFKRLTIQADAEISCSIFDGFVDDVLVPQLGVGAILFSCGNDGVIVRTAICHLKHVVGQLTADKEELALVICRRPCSTTSLSTPSVHRICVLLKIKVVTPLRKANLLRNMLHITNMHY